MMLQEQGKAETNDERKERLAAMRIHLKRTIDLAPQFIEAYSWLGYVSIGLREELSETEALLKKALSLAPGRYELSMDLAQVMIVNNETAAARALITPLKNSTHAKVRDRAEELLEQIAMHLENEEALRAYERRKQDLTTATVDRDDDNDDDSSAPDAHLPPKLTRTPARSSEGPVIETAKIDAAASAKGPQITGLLKLIDCSRGVTLRIQVGNGNIDLHSDDPGNIQFISTVAAVKDAITCGPVTPAINVTITYKPGTDGRFLGEPLVVTFVEKQ
jgi:hypothetical protein